VVVKLPVVMEQTSEQHLVYGREMIAQGMFEDPVTGAKILPDIMYMQDMPVLIAVNHKRRLKEAYKNKGTEGIASYIDSVTNLVKQAS
jgi:hypothetical protein